MAIDFLTAFGRLLRDGALRDAFAASPQAAAEQIQLRPADLPAWRQLAPDEVEAQALVLLRKRLERVSYFAPETCRQPGEKLWPLFHTYARATWPPADHPKSFDAFQFCQHLKTQTSEPVAASEWNRLEFALSQRRAAWHWVTWPTQRRNRRGFQFFLRGCGQRWREFFFYFGL